MPSTQFLTEKKTLTMPTTKQTIAQWPFERLYVPPFTQKRGFDERSLTYKMVPMESARQLTGIRVLDMVVDRLIKGPGPQKNPRYRGYTDPKLSATVRELTGLTLPELRLHWHMQVARDLLRYTELPLTEVMQRCGYTSMPTFSRTYRRWWHTSPQRARIAARNRGDIGKYAL